MNEQARADWIEASFPRTVRHGRLAAAILVGGALAGMTWLFVLQELHSGRIFGRQWTQQDFPDGLGHAFGAHDTARAGLWLTLALGVLAAALYAAIERWLPGRGMVKGLSFAVIPFVAWGLLFCTVVNARQVLFESDASFHYLPTGLFGWSSDHRTVLLGAAASIATGLVLARVVPLMRGEVWWREHSPEGAIAEETTAALLELPEERPEQRVEGSQ